MRIVKKICKIIFNILIFCITFILALYAGSKFILKDSVPNVFGFSILKVVSGSMEPYISVGDYVIIKQSEDYKIGDVVAYTDSSGSLVTHRIVEINGSEIKTKGDANNTDDKTFDKENIHGKMVYKIHDIFSNVSFTTTILILCLIFFVGCVIIIFIPDEKRS